MYTDNEKSLITSLVNMKNECASHINDNCDNCPFSDSVNKCLVNDNPPADWSIITELPVRKLLF